MTVRVPLNDLSRDTHTEADLALVNDTVRTGWFVLGAQVKGFEAEFASYLGAAGCVGVANGTDALMLGMRAVGVEPGDTVLMAANAGMYAAAAAVAVGAVPAWVEVLPRRASLDPDALEARLVGDRPAAVVVTHLYGLMADIARISEICRVAGVPLIEDCAQSAGASLDGRAAGTWGACGTYSFYPTKNLAAWGDAGAVVSTDPDLLERVRRLHQYGWRSRYHADVPRGVNSRMDEMQATVLRARLPRLDAENEVRRAILSRYASALPPNARLFFEDTPACVGHLAVIAFSSEEERDSARAALDAAGVGTDVHYPVPDHLQPALEDVAGDVRLPVTEELARRILTIPCFPTLTESEVEQVRQALIVLGPQV